MSEFNLEKRAEELFRWKGASPITFMGNEQAAITALQLARELAEAIAAELDACRYDTAAKIARSFASPRTREDVYREALERIARLDCHDDPPDDVARAALDRAQQEEA